MRPALLSAPARMNAVYGALAALAHRAGKVLRVRRVAGLDVLAQPFLHKLDRSARHAPLGLKRLSRQFVHFGMKFPVLFDVLLEPGIAQYPHQAFLQREVRLDKAAELDHRGIGQPSAVPFRSFLRLRDDDETVEYLLVLQIQLGYPEQVVVLPFQIFNPRLPECAGNASTGLIRVQEYGPDFRSRSCRTALPGNREQGYSRRPRVKNGQWAQHAGKVLRFLYGGERKTG